MTSSTATAALDYEAVITAIRKFREALPASLRADFDKTLKDLAGIAEAELNGYIKDTAGKALGGLVGGIAASSVNKVVNAGIDSTVSAIEATASTEAN